MTSTHALKLKHENGLVLMMLNKGIGEFDISFQLFYEINFQIFQFCLLYSSNFNKMMFFRIFSIFIERNTISDLKIN